MPGLLFLLVYQLFAMAYTGYIAFTNYGDGHNSTKADAVEAILVQNERRVEGSAAYPLTVVEQGDELGFAIVDADGASRSARPSSRSSRSTARRSRTARSRRSPAATC